MFFTNTVDEQDQYHQTIRNLIVIIGSLFSKMLLVRKNHKTGEIEEKISVPINFANRDKLLTLVREAPTVETKNSNYTLPRIGFSFEGLNYDSVRQMPKTGGRGRPTKNEKNKKDVLIQYNAVPYNFDFSVSIVTKYAEDLTQLVEKILPYFAPNLNITYRAIPEMELDIDVPIILNAVTWQDQYEGLQERRLLIADLSLTAKSYIFPPIKDFPRVNTVLIETHTLATSPDLHTNNKKNITGPTSEKIVTETSGVIQDESASISMNHPSNAHSLIKVYGYNEVDDFGFETFVYESGDYGTERQREERYHEETANTLIEENEQ